MIWSNSVFSQKMKNRRGGANDEEQKPEVEFSEIMGEEHNYLVLFFDNDVDWIQAQTLFDIKPVKCGSTRNDGVITDKMVRKGIGRVLNGAVALEKIMGGIK